MTNALANQDSEQVKTSDLNQDKQKQQQEKEQVVTVYIHWLCKRCFNRHLMYQYFHSASGKFQQVFDDDD